MWNCFHFFRACGSFDRSFCCSIPFVRGAYLAHTWCFSTATRSCRLAIMGTFTNTAAQKPNLVQWLLISHVFLSTLFLHVNSFVSSLRRRSVCCVIQLQRLLDCNLLYLFNRKKWQHLLHHTLTRYCCQNPRRHRQPQIISSELNIILYFEFGCSHSVRGKPDATAGTASEQRRCFY